MRRVATLVINAMLLVGIFTILHFTPSEADRLNPMPTYGEIGETVDTGGFSITVHKVQLARALVAEDEFGPPPPVKTKGIWVVLTATVVGEWEPTTYSDAGLETRDGYVYDVSDRTDPSVTTLTQDFHPGPGIGRRGPIVFEIPKDRLAGAVLHIGRTAATDSRLGPEAVIDLRIDEAEAERMAGEAPEQVTLKPVEFT